MKRLMAVMALAAVTVLFISQGQTALAVVPTAATGLEVEVVETGKIFLSADGAGSNSSAGVTIEVEKPNAAATVRSAYLSCASNFGRIIADGHVSIDGTPITWDLSVQNNAGSLPIFFNNVWADITSVVSAKINAAAPGLIGFTQTEVSTTSLDGCGLYVIFDDPSQPTDNTVILLFGGQDTNGESFAISLAAPLEAGDTAEMGLGISFSAQGNSQVSLIDGNGARITSSAGGQDDGSFANGALMTVGGIGDSTANPGNPLSPPVAPNPTRTDDELYDLTPFLGAADTLVTLDTVNPSDDDNIFIGHFFLSTPAVVGEGITLSPLDATNPVGTDHTVTAKVVDTAGAPVVGRTVDFEVVSGPNAGDTGSGVTDTSGEASFTYTGDGGAGVDSIVATMTDSQGVVQTSNTSTKTWVQDEEPTCSAQVTYLPDGSTFASSTVAVPNGPAGTFGFDSIMTNTGSHGLSGIVSDIAILTGGNLLLSADNGAGAVGDLYTLPLVGDYADGVLSPGESVAIPHLIGLAAFSQFDFFVDVDCSVTPIVK